MRIFRPFRHATRPVASPSGLPPCRPICCCRSAWWKAAGARDVDVGCFQISLADHPDAFATLADAFDPVQNADYAAGFLRRLQSRTGSWDSAIADYHSDTPDLGLPYERRVLAVWHNQGVARLDANEADPFVILQSKAARRVHVYTLDDPATAGLPRVITP